MPRDEASCRGCACAGRVQVQSSSELDGTSAMRAARRAVSSESLSMCTSCHIMRGGCDLARFSPGPARAILASAE